MTEMGVTGGYVRHRDRMVQESVFQDLRDTLIACRWMTGTISRPVVDPYNRGAGYVSSLPARPILPLLEGHEIVLIDYFPETENGGSGTAMNTLAMDGGDSSEAVPLELGSNAEARGYTFTMAFYAVSDAAARAVLNDLRDRYLGRSVRGDNIELFDFVANSNQATVDMTPIVRMDVESFRYAMDNSSVAGHEVHLYFAELTLTDFIDGWGPHSVPSP